MEDGGGEMESTCGDSAEEIGGIGYGAEEPRDWIGFYFVG